MRFAATGVVFAYGDRYCDIDTDLAGFNLALIPAGTGSRLREDGRPITILISVDELDSFIQGADGETDEDGTENLFAVTSHMRQHIGDDSWSHLQVHFQ